MATPIHSLFGYIACLRGSHNFAVHTCTRSIIAFRAPRATYQSSNLLEVLNVS